jgi:CRISPR-associated protein Cmr4
MSVWSESSLIGIYTLTATHFGTGQATGGVDLPIARDRSTGFPVLPASGLKGVARDYISEVLQDGDRLNTLFGKAIDAAGNGDDLQAGLLAFTEARLLAYPVRSLNRPFLHVTCPLILERLTRDLRLLDHADFLPTSWTGDWPLDNEERPKVYVADVDLAESALVLEDLVFRAEEVRQWQPLVDLGNRLGELLPTTEPETRGRLASGLVVIPDCDFADLMQRVIPIQARIKLTGGKTTDQWTNPETNVTESGNLWYEEHLPPDCLFLAFVGHRRQRTFSRARAQNTSAGSEEASLETFTAAATQLQVVQIGGNETVGQGLCFYTLWPSVTVSAGE